MEERQPQYPRLRFCPAAFGTCEREGCLFERVINKDLTEVASEFDENVSGALRDLASQNGCVIANEL